jgi:hypothetical protein
MPISFTIKIPPDIDRDEFLRELFDENADSNTSSEVIKITKNALAQVAFVSQEMDRILDDQFHAKYDNIEERDTANHSQNIHHYNATRETIGVVVKEPSMESPSSISFEKKEEEEISFKRNAIEASINHRLQDKKRLRSKVKKLKKQSATSNLDQIEERFQ